MSEQGSHELLTTAEVARLLRVDVTTVQRWAHDGALEAVVLSHVGRRHLYRIARSTVLALLDGKHG